MANSGGKISASNTFDGGLITDLHILTTPNNTTVDARNMELVTIGENQYIYQNIKGNEYIADFGKYTDKDGLKYDFIPLGLKVRNNIGYILVGAFKGAEFLAGGIGTFPSPNWEDLNSVDISNTNRGKSQLYETFSFLHNFSSTPTGRRTEPFISTLFKFEKNKHIEIDIQGDYDGSVNIIFTDNINYPNIINSRFKVPDAGKLVYLAERAGDRDSNTYTDGDWDRIALIQSNNSVIQLTDSNGNPGSGIEVLPGGVLKGGGYRYFLKYVTQEGNTTEIIYESPLISIANGGLSLSKSEASDKLVRFYLKNLDTSYHGISVYFAHINGEEQAQMELYKINYVFTFNTIGSLTIAHTGLEDVTPIDQTELSTSFTAIDTVKSIAIINDRLALAGSSSSISDSDIKILSDAAKKITLWEKTEVLTVVDKDVINDYSNPNLAAHKVGYWKGEVYEFAAIFLLRNKGLSPGFPVTGMDNIGGVQSSFEEGIYPPGYTLEEDGFSNDYLINNKGMFRTSLSGNIYIPKEGGVGDRVVTYIEANTSALKGIEGLDGIATGVFIIRRERIKNVLMQGMAVPTVKLPTKYPIKSVEVDPKYTALSAAKRYLTWNYINATLGLNGQYRANYTREKESRYSTTPAYNDDFDVMFLPQPTQILNFTTPDRSWPYVGRVGQSSTVYGETIDQDGKSLKRLHIAFYSCEIDLNLPSIRGYLNGINPAIEVQQMKNGSSPVGYTYLKGYNTPQAPSTKTRATIIIRNAEVLSYDRAPITLFEGKSNRATLLDSGITNFADGGFSSKADRVFGFIGFKVSSNEVYDTEEIPNPDDPYNQQTSDVSSMYVFPWKSKAESPVQISIQSNSLYKAGKSRDDHYLDPYSVVEQAYSRYMGIEITNPKIIGGVFNYFSPLKTAISSLPNSSEVMIDSTGSVGDRKFVNVGHLTNVFRSSKGRWTSQNLRDLYKFDSGSFYHAVTDRVTIDVPSISIYRGDGYISRIFKKTSYKPGILTAPSATAADANLYGVGLMSTLRLDRDDEDYNINRTPEEERDDPGRALIDNGQVLEIISQASINADIRALEKFSVEESLIHNGDRNFYPNKLNVFSDTRPDSTSYNHGYTGDVHPVVYSILQEYAPSINTEFPNRIFLSERNKSQSFYNTFRDIKGFNYRDYGVELGPIVKIIAIKNVLLTIHPTGVLMVGVDDRTLVADGTDVYVNTAQALSPTSKTISDVYGSTNPESVIRAGITVAGVDYSSNAVWLFEGDKLSVISEFAIKTLLSSYKESITKMTEGTLIYEPKVYSSYDLTKHILYITYVAQNIADKSQTHIGTVSYSTILQKWVSTIDGGHKFMMSNGSVTYSTGFNFIKDNKLEVRENSIWKEDVVLTASGSSNRCKIRGDQYDHWFEIIINSESALEKILDNIRIITNKRIPTTITYTTTGEENGAVTNIRPSDSADKILVQDIYTREMSEKNSYHLGILDQNAYYKNSGLYIEVAKMKGSFQPSIGNRRVRDKVIKVKFTYSGPEDTFIQAIISTLSISYT